MAPMRPESLTSLLFCHSMGTASGAPAALHLFAGPRPILLLLLYMLQNQSGLLMSLSYCPDE